ncbi:MAG: 16S rRNA (cytidine(1402)-2'-O)-methyltransferase [Tuberibacillus sp.]
MQEQKSFQNEPSQGALYVVPTPIGNLEDMTFRALNILKTVDTIAAEDTRQTLKLCRHYEIDTPLISYHEHNKKTSGPKLISMLKEGQTIAIVTDAGIPGISDPGEDLVADCIKENIPVIPLPGANAAVTALVASGLTTEHFFFWGFLPRRTKEKQSTLEGLKDFPYTLIFYEAPHRLKETVQDLRKVFGNRKITLARELTKRYETFLRGDLDSIENWVREEEVKGECCLIVEGGTPHEETPWWEGLDPAEHVDFYIKEKDLPKKEAIKAAALDRGVPKRDIYNLYHNE